MGKIIKTITIKKREKHEKKKKTKSLVEKVGGEARESFQGILVVFQEALRARITKNTD